MARIKVYVHACDAISEAGLRSLIRLDADLELVEATQIDSADVAVVGATAVGDWSEHALAGIQRDGRPPVILVLDEVTGAAVVDAAGLGARGIMRRPGTTAVRLRSAIDRVLGGLTVVPDDLVGELLDRAVSRPSAEARPSISDRERKVLDLLAEGSSTAEIGNTLGYSERTVKGVIHDLTTRLQLKNRSHAVAYALRNGVI